MSLQSKKAIAAGTWVSILGIVALSTDLTSVAGWPLLVALAILPPLVMLWVWNRPEPTLSESIRAAQR